MGIVQTMTQLIKASKDDLTMCPGLGPQKVKHFIRTHVYVA